MTFDVFGRSMNKTAAARDRFGLVVASAAVRLIRIDGELRLYTRKRETGNQWCVACCA